MRKRRLLAVVSVVAALSIAEAVTTTPHITDLGVQTVGSRLSEVRHYKPSTNCLIEGGKADCVFTDPNGVEYVVLDDAVVAVTANIKTASPKLKLPFGLYFGDTIDVAIRKMTSAGKTWLVGSDHAGGIALSSYDKYAGRGNWKFTIEARFDDRGLTEIRYNSETV